MSKKQTAEPNLIIKLFRYLTNKTFFKNILYMIVFLAVLLIGLNIYLRSYTNHGQKLSLPDFEEMNITDAKRLAKDLTFEIIVNDSTQIVGKPGGMIINQNPTAFSLVKENRKVYVTTTKYIADRIKMNSFPELYGREYKQKQKELSFMKVNCRVKDYMYDPGSPDHILEVYYNGKKIVDKDGRDNSVTIEKGGTLDFVLSKKSGLQISVPDLSCQTLASAQFLIEDGARLVLGKIMEEGEVTDRESAYIIKQYPTYHEEGTMLIGDQIDVWISQEQPEDCI